MKQITVQDIENSRRSYPGLWYDALGSYERWCDDTRNGQRYYRVSDDKYGFHRAIARYFQIPFTVEAKLNEEPVLVLFI